MSTEIIKVINELSFPENEIALQALSGKIEFNVRDKVFYDLVVKYPDIITRKEVGEFTSSGRSPSVDLMFGSIGLEFKAYIAADIQREFMRNKIKAAVESDFSKLQQLGFEESYAVLVLAIPKIEIPKEVLNRVRYPHRASTMEECLMEVSLLFPRKVLHSKCVSAGTIFGVPIEVGVFIISQEDL